MPPHEIRADIPRPLSAIVMKLMEKKLEEDVKEVRLSTRLTSSGSASAVDGMLFTVNEYGPSMRRASAFRSRRLEFGSE